MRSLLAYLALLAVVTFAHYGFYPIAADLWSWDSGPFMLVAEDVSHGKFSAFYYNHYYGGAVLSWFHGAWVKCVQLLSQRDLLWAHHSFYYAVVPTALSISTYEMLRAFSSRRSAFLVALIPAFGFLSWIVFYSATEYYVAGYILGCFLLKTRIKWGEPLKIESTFKKFAFFVCVGFAVYTYRAMVIYALGLVVPWKWITQQSKIVLTDKSRMAKTMRSLIWILLALYVLLDLFGGKLGEYNGKAVKLNAQPNLKIAVILAMFLWAWVRRMDRRLINWKAFVLPCSGLFLGALPEIVSKLSHPISGMDSGTRLASLPQVLETITLIPDRLRELITSTTEAPLGSVGQTPLHFVSFILVVLSLTILFRHAKRQEQYKFLIFTVSLSGVTFCCVSSYATANTRWLFSSLPVMFIGTAWLLEHFIKKYRYGAVIVSTLLAGHFSNQWIGRKTLQRFAIERPEQLPSWTMGKFSKMNQVIETFKSAQLDLVISDSHFWSNNLSVLSKRKPLFVSKEWSPIEG
ncbi:MAG: hypothetical protein EOP04_16850, partial [Proteobacteria bacterium]